MVAVFSALPPPEGGMFRPSPPPPPPPPPPQVVMLLRLITSCEVQRREDFFFPFIMVRGGYSGDGELGCGLFDKLMPTPGRFAQGSGLLSTRLSCNVRPTWWRTLQSKDIVRHRPQPPALEPCTATGATCAYFRSTCLPPPAAPVVRAAGHVRRPARHRGAVLPALRGAHGRGVGPRAHRGSHGGAAGGKGAQAGSGLPVTSLSEV